MAHTLDTLPDLCLSLIFSHIPLEEVILNISLVCNKFHQIAQQNLASRRTLVLYEDVVQLDEVRQTENVFRCLEVEHIQRDDGTKWVTHRTNAQIEFDALMIPIQPNLTQGLTGRFTTRLIATLRNITRLTMVSVTIPSGPALARLVRLLNRYAPNLIYLCLSFEHFNINRRTTSVASLIDAINRMTSLRHLVLNVDLPELFNRVRLPELTLTILPQLDSIMFDRVDDTPWLTESLRQLENGRATSIACGAIIPVEVLLQFDHQLCNRIDRISVEFLNLTEASLGQFCTRYSRLISLKLSTEMIPLRTLARHLSQLTQLVHLELLPDGFGPPDDDITPLVQVPSVRFLLLFLITKSHRETEQLRAAEIFPNLQVIIFHQDAEQCDLCGFEYGEIIGEERIEECMRLSRQPFRACVNLHTFKIEVPLEWEDLLHNGYIPIDQI